MELNYIKVTTIFFIVIAGDLLTTAISLIIPGFYESNILFGGIGNNINWFNVILFNIIIIFSIYAYIYIILYNNILIIDKVPSRYDIIKELLSGRSVYNCFFPKDSLQITSYVAMIVSFYFFFKIAIIMTNIMSMVLVVFFKTAYSYQQYSLCLFFCVCFFMAIHFIDIIYNFIWCKTL